MEVILKLKRAAVRRSLHRLVRPIRHLGRASRRCRCRREPARRLGPRRRSHSSRRRSRHGDDLHRGAPFPVLSRQRLDATAGLQLSAIPGAERISSSAVEVCMESHRTAANQLRNLIRPRESFFHMAGAAIHDAYLALRAVVQRRLTLRVVYIPSAAWFNMVFRRIPLDTPPRA